MVERFEAPALKSYGFKQNPLPCQNGSWVRHTDYADLERENAALRDDDAKMQLLHQQEDQLIAAERKIAELERKVAESRRRNEEMDREITGLRNSYWEERKAHLAADARAALSGSGSEWREPEPIKEVKALRQALLECRERAETGGRRIETAMDACEDISEIATCALPPEGWQGPAAPQQGGE